jgi:thiamine biosynthesis protein ThiI
MAKMKLVVLMSGGIDSPVAAWQMINLDCKVILVHFHNYTTNDASVKEKIVRLTEVLSKYQPKLKLYLVSFKDVQTEIIKFIPSKLRMIITRRMMLRIASKILEKEKADALVTGDNLAQVASQTLENLNVIHKATSHPILTPLLGENKLDIIKTARKIGTYELSILPYSDCCSFLIDKHPETKAKIEQIIYVEKNLRVENLVEKALKNLEIKTV